MNNWLVSFLLFLGSATGALATPQNCDEARIRVDQTKIQRLSSRDYQDCYITVSNTNNYVDLIYRDYLISNDSLLVFISLGDGPTSSNTGAKEFYFFPRSQRDSSFQVSENAKEVVVNGQYNFSFIFDAATSQISSMINANVKVDPKVSANNDGGVYITPTSGLVYELPFNLGGAPSADKNLYGIFKDAFSHECPVRVGKIFSITSDGESVIKYNDIELKKILAQLCPQIRY